MPDQLRAGSMFGLFVVGVAITVLVGALTNAINGTVSGARDWGLCEQPGAVPDGGLDGGYLANDRE